LTTGVGIGYSAIHAGAEILNLNLANPLQHIDIPLLKDVFQASIAADPTATVPVSDPASASPAHDSDLGTAALVVSGLSIAAKEILFRYTLKVGEAANSSAVIANAWQHRLDES
jgi:divalent metal cation (Fe/Co/Zn/Cd) transporter